MSKSRTRLLTFSLLAVILLPATDLFARGGGRGGGGGGGSRGGGGGGGAARPQQPPPENPALAEDRRQIASATTAFNSANLAYINGNKTFTETFMKTPEYADAQKAVDDANKALNAARDAVMAKLKPLPDYKAAVQKEADAKKKLDAINTTGGDRDQRAAQAKIIMDAGSAVVKMENDALAKDTDYLAAKKNLADAVAALQVQKDKLAEAIKADPDLAKLKQTKDSAQTTLDDARKKLAADSAK